MGHSTLIIIIAIAVIVVLFPIFLLKRKSSAQGGSAEKASGDQAQLYVGNLAYRVHERDLRKLFSTYGDISSIRVVKDRRSGRSKGFGFVTFASAKSANRALAAHGESFMGRNLVVRIAKPR